MSTKISNPLDSFVRELLSKIDNARDFLQNYLPEYVVEHLDLTTVKLEKETFIDQQLREVRSDLLFKLRLRDGVKASIYVLFEHKSYPEPMISLDILRYMVRIWDQWLKQDKTLKQLPPIISLVLYHGQKKWNIARQFSGLITDSDKFSEFIPNFHYSLCDLSKYSDEEIKRGERIIQGALLTLKYSHSQRIVNKLPGIFDLYIDIFDTPRGRAALHALLHYLVRGIENIQKKDLKHALTEVFKDKGDDVMATIAEQWTQEKKPIWIQKGIEQGIIQDAQEGIIDIIEARFDRVPKTLIKKINSITEIDLLKHLRRVAATVSSISEFEKQL